MGVFSSRKSALACERHVAFRAIVGEDRPDFRTSSDCRKWHLEACKAVLTGCKFSVAQMLRSSAQIEGNRIIRERCAQKNAWDSEPA